MRVRLLGTAAGGGLPQWNCDCANCHAAREAPDQVRPRTESSIAISADGAKWILVNASSDVREHIRSFRPLGPPPGRLGSGIERILLTNGDFDHTLGLTRLREGPPMKVTGTSSLQTILQTDLRLTAALNRYAGIEWNEPPVNRLSPLLAGDGSPTGIEYYAFSAPGKLPRYVSPERPTVPGDNVGYRFVDSRSHRRLVYIPGIAEFNDTVRNEINACDTLLFDGSFWQEDDMARCGRADSTASELGHLVIDGDAGSLLELSRLQPRPRIIYIHINHTNPMLPERDSSERNLVETSGLAIGYDGMELSI